MVEAAFRGLHLAEGRDLEIAPDAKAWAQKISEGESLTADEVKAIEATFSETRARRTPEWGKPGEETDAYVAHMLCGGDAGLIWAKSAVREIGLSEDKDAESTTDEPTVHVYKELFFDEAGAVTMDNDGRIWKPVLREGTWAVGPNGRSLRVIPGRSHNQREVIGMQDIVDAHNEGAVEHVTIPLSHDDRVDENTGYVDKGCVKIVRGEDGVHRMYVGHRFTEPDVKAKVERGSIANTSVGLEFDYVRKEDGRRFPVVLKHVALTNRPWINRLTPFGVQASEGDAYEVESLVFAEPNNDSSNHSEKEMSEAMPQEIKDFSETEEYQALKQKNEELEAQLARQNELIAHFAEKEREREADQLIADLKAVGFTEEAGCTEFLKFSRSLMLSDKGETAVLLSEDGQAERPLSIAGVLRELFSKLPQTNGEGKRLQVQFSEMVSDPLGLSEFTRPDAEPKHKPTTEELDREYEAMFGSIQVPTQV